MQPVLSSPPNGSRDDVDCRPIDTRDPPSHVSPYISEGSPPSTSAVGERYIGVPSVETRRSIEKPESSLRNSVSSAVPNDEILHLVDVDEEAIT